MPSHKSNDYKLTAVQYYLVEDKTQEEVCKIFKCTPRSLMRWVERYKNEGNVNIHYRRCIKKSNIPKYMLSNTCDAKHRYFVAYLPTFRLFIVIFCYQSGNRNMLYFL